MEITRDIKPRVQMQPIEKYYELFFQAVTIFSYSTKSDYMALTDFI